MEMDKNFSNCQNVLGKREINVVSDAAPTQKMMRISSPNPKMVDKENINLNETIVNKIDNITVSNLELNHKELQKSVIDLPFCDEDNTSVENSGTTIPQCSILGTTLSKIEKDENKSEIDKIRKRRSSVLPRRSSISRLSRMSPSSTLPFGGAVATNSSTYSSIDPRSILARHLPYTSRINLLFQMGLEYLLCRTEKDLASNNKLDVLKNCIQKDSESICSKIATDVVEYISRNSYISSLDADGKDSKILIAAYNSQTEILKKENNRWNVLKKERNFRMKQAEMALKESKKGETRLEEEEVQNMMSTKQKAMLGNVPDYDQLIKNVRLSAVQLLRVKDQIDKTKRLVSNCVKVTKLETDAGYAIIENDLH